MAVTEINAKTITIGDSKLILIDGEGRTLIGDLSSLSTTAKNNLVAAINELAEGGVSITIDSTLSSSSTNPVQNKVIKDALDLKAPLASPTFTGTPTAPTPTTSDNSTKIATTAYVKSSLPAVATATPLMDGTAAVGTSAKLAKEDHVHPSDTSKITMPTGGSTGQVLKKTPNGTEWANESGGWSITTVNTDGAVSQAMSEGVYYDFTGILTSLTVTFGGSASGHYHFAFVADTAITLTVPNSVQMPDSFAVEANKIYEVDICNYLGTVQSWSYNAS